jgi:hypothetical protein
MIPEQDARQAITLAGQGANVSEIARRLGHDSKKIRTYLNGHRAPGQPRPHTDSFTPFAYIRQRAQDDRHLRSTGLHREITVLGYAGSYSAFTRELRGHGITASCGTCRKWKPIRPAQPGQRYPGPLPYRTRLGRVIQIDLATAPDIIRASGITRPPNQTQPGQLAAGPAGGNNSPQRGLAARRGRRGGTG